MIFDAGETLLLTRTPGNDEDAASCRRIKPPPKAAGPEIRVGRLGDALAKVKL